MKGIEMKIYRFYLIKDKKYPFENCNDILDNRIELYAITNSKSKAKEFREQRDMNKFIEKSSKCEMDEWISFSDENRGNVLRYIELDTSDVSESGLIYTMTMKVLATDYEYTSIDQDASIVEINDESFWLCNAPNPLMFKNKIIKLFKSIDYYQMFMLYNYALLEDSQCTPMDIEYYENIAPDVILDEYGLFITYFGHTFKV